MTRGPIDPQRVDEVTFDIDGPVTDTAGVPLAAGTRCFEPVAPDVVTHLADLDVRAQGGEWHPDERVAMALRRLRPGARRGCGRCCARWVTAGS